MFLDSFVFGESDKHVYPNWVLAQKQFQQQLAAKLEEHVKEAQSIHAHSQFIIATHSPFLMAMEGAKVIDLDSCPSRERPWFELPNMVAYYQFFQKHAHQFGKGHDGQ